MSLQERSNLILAFAKVLFINGQTTEQTVASAERIGRALGLQCNIIARWGELELLGADKGAQLSAQIVADPTGVDMERVVSTMRAVEDVVAGRLAPDAAPKAIAAIAEAPPAPTWLFAF